MALISCSACGHQISEAARACPSCGHPNGREPLTRTDVAGRAVTALGAWLVSEWVVKAIFIIVIGVVAVVLFSR